MRSFRSVSCSHEDCSTAVISVSMNAADILVPKQTSRLRFIAAYGCSI